MSVYVDKAKNPYGRMLMSHMLADTLEELLAMADKIGVKRKWYQGFDKASCPHFDICQAKRELAVKYGAIEIDRHELWKVITRIKHGAVQRAIEEERTGWELNDDVRNRKQVQPAA